MRMIEDKGRALMSTRMLTGLLLIIGPIVLLAGFIGFTGSGAVDDWSNTDLVTRWQEVREPIMHD